VSESDNDWLDAGVPTLYDVSTVHIFVGDVNDNHPSFTHPPPSDNHSALVELTSSVRVGHVVTQLSATDDDVGVNAQLSYSIISDDDDDDDEHATQSFDVDAESGEIRVTAPLDPGRTYHLLVAATDAGMPRLTSHAHVHVMVSQTVDVISSRRLALLRDGAGGVTDWSWWLVAGGCLAAGLVAMLATFCLVMMASVKRRRRTRRRGVSLGDTCTTTTAPIRPPPPSLDALMTDVDPLTSAVLRRHDVTVLQQHAPAGRCDDYMYSTALVSAVNVTLKSPAY